MHGSAQRRNGAKKEPANLRKCNVEVILNAPSNKSAEGNTSFFYTILHGSAAAEIVQELCSTQHALGINIEADIFMPSRRVWIDKEKEGNGSQSRLACAARFCAIFSLAICLAACGERSQDLEERVTQLQKELNRTQ